MVLSSERVVDVLLYGQIRVALPGGAEVRCGPRGGRDRRTWLADATGLLTVPHQDHFDRRRLIDPKDANIMEVRLLHPAVPERHLAVEGAADAEDDPTLDLRLHGAGVHDCAALDPAPNP